MTGRRRVVSGILFSPRGGSAHAARALNARLPGRAGTSSLVAGSRRDAGPGAGRARVLRGARRPAASSTSPRRSQLPTRCRRGPGVPPMHPSFEDRPVRPTACSRRSTTRRFERQVAAWSAALRAVRAPHADVLHLHHLTPIDAAAARVAPGVPVVTQLHGTELHDARGDRRGARRALAPRRGWAERLRDWAARVLAARRRHPAWSRPRPRRARRLARSPRGRPQRRRCRRASPPRPWTAPTSGIACSSTSRSAGGRGSLRAAGARRERRGRRARSAT